MQVGDLVRHVIHSGALGIIVETSKDTDLTKVHWLNNTWGLDWTLDQNIEVIDKNEVFS